MGAENWALCPKCKILEDEIRQALIKNIKDGYGVMRESEYLSLVERSKAPIVLKETLREDYEIGIWKGSFWVKYEAYCDKCGFEKVFKTNEAIEI